jgi:hypothetical protein
MKGTQVPYDEENITGKIVLQASRPILQMRNLRAFTVKLKVSLLETPEIVVDVRKWKSKVTEVKNKTCSSM